VAIAVTVDGKRLLFTGDQWAGGGTELNYVYKNRFRPADYRETAELLRQLQPDLLLSGHWDPITVTPELLDELLDRGARLEELHSELLYAERPEVTICPYQSEGPGPFPVAVQAPAGAAVRLVVPEGWSVATDGGVFTLAPPNGAQVRRARIAADVTLSDGRRLGQIAEALITVTTGVR
jgi:hypothetical protein